MLDKLSKNKASITYTLKVSLKYNLLTLMNIYMKPIHSTSISDNTELFYPLYFNDTLILYGQVK